MTREEALLKLLRVEPAGKGELVQCTGWPTAETLELLDKLLAEKKVRCLVRARDSLYCVKEFDEDALHR